MPTGNIKDSSIEYCRDVVQRYDPDRYFLSLFLKGDDRARAWVVFAFNHEIAKTFETVSEPQLGLIRLQWWRERLVELFEGGEAAANEILQGLQWLIANFDVKQEDFEILLTAREFDMAGEVPKDMAQVLKHIDGTNAPLLRLIGQVDDAVARNYGLVGLVRAVPHYAMQGRVYLPRDLLDEHGCKISDLKQGKNTETLSPVVETMLQNFTGVRASTRFLKAMQGLSELYFRQLRKCGYNPFAVAQEKPIAFRELRVFLNSIA